MNTKGEVISRIRNGIKSAKADAFLTDRLIYTTVLKVAKFFIKRKDDGNKLGRYNDLFQKYPGVKLIEVSKIEAGCADIDSCCKFFRTEDKLPPILTGSYGPLIREVSSVDGSKEVHRTYAKTYAQMVKTATFKYNKKQYYWISNDYLYFPNFNWPIIDIDAMWENDISEFLCSADDCCVDRRSERTNIPDDLFVEIETPIIQELLTRMQLPKDNIVDGQALIKS